MLLRLPVIAGASLALSGLAQAQAPATKDSFPVPRLFREQTPIALTFTANLGQLKKDRGSESPYRSATLSYAGDSGKTVTVPLRVKTHGIWRLKHCDLPPLRFNFSNKQAKGTIFHDLERPKVVSVCRTNDRYEQLLLQEYQLYRIYQLITPASHRARLVRMTYVDSASGKAEVTRYAFIFEDPDQLAARLHGIMAKTKGATASDLDPEAASLVYAFQYLIGNTDLSFNGLHNGEIVLRPDGTPLIPVAYDFDFSGAVNAPYATPDPQLGIRRVRDRLFRGYCAYMEDYPAAFEQFRARKNDIYALYHDDIGKLLDAGVVNETLAYFDDFYKDIRDAGAIKRVVQSTCMGQR